MWNVICGIDGDIVNGLVKRGEEVIRIRFHGRGGHGVKTASRIVGTAAFQAGYFTQDSPLYGAERRGAPVAAFTRISSQPILERGVIVDPDLIVVGDETLLGDTAAGALVGLESARAVFVNTRDAGRVHEKFPMPAEVWVLDITERTLQRLGKASALSVGLAAAAARLIGILSEAHLLSAVREELEHSGLSAPQWDDNLALASEIFAELSPVSGLEGFRADRPGTDSICPVPHQGPLLSTPSILAAGNSSERNTGTWRVERPEINYDVCTRCGICFVRCPDGAIALDAEGFPVIDYEHCKGCMECWNQCPVEGAIHKEKEVRAW
jgi:pyruvate ferredoxin oxidoreductase gamma subunit